MAYEQVTVTRVKEYMRDWMDLTAIKHLVKYATDEHLFFLATDRNGSEHEYRVQRQMNPDSNDWNVEIECNGHYEFWDAIGAGL